MNARHRFSVLTCILLVMLSVGLSRPAAAQWAVIDVASIQQLVQQYQTLQQQLTAAQASLTQAQLQYAALTGGRGMERLLSGINRNYLPPDWTTLNAAMQGGAAGYGGLSASTQSILAANAVLSPSDLARLAPTERAHLQDARQSAALLQAVSRQALSTTSARFASLQQLINTIGTTNDPKASLDLQARIAAEQAMLVNDSAKLEAIYHTVEAEERARRQRRQEQAIADIGSLRRLPPMGLN